MLRKTMSLGEHYLKRMLSKENSVFNRELPGEYFLGKTLSAEEHCLSENTVFRRILSLKNTAFKRFSPLEECCTRRTSGKYCSRRALS